MKTAVAIALAVALTTVAPAKAEVDLGDARVDFGTSHQRLDGFGFSQAFQRADVMHGARGLPPAKQRELLDLFLSPAKGAGLTILRNGIGSSPDDVYDHMKSIQPEDPGRPDAPPKYVWDGDDGGQVWLSKEARSYGVKRFYANAWSAPGYMKDNGSDSGGGTLCGLAGTDCESGDWRQAYANYLAQYVRFYAQEGIRITDLGFTNEPELSTSYASMRFTPAQAVEFIKVLGPTLKRAGLKTKITCCDAVGWEAQREYTEAIEADPRARRWVRTHTGHRYSSPARLPLPTRRNTWMSEWSPNGTTWNEAWDDGSGYDGLTVAEDIHESLTTADVNAYVYWFGASLGTTRAFVQLDGENYHVSKRLWAMAAYSRFIRPGARRVEATAPDEELKISAFRNKDGRRVVVILNTGAARTSEIELDGPARRVASYLTDESHDLARTGLVTGNGAVLTAKLPARSLTSVVLR